MQPENLNELEKELTILDLVWSMINETVNWSIFEKGLNYQNDKLTIRSWNEQRLFAILFRDFLSIARVDSKNNLFNLPHLPAQNGSYLDYLEHVCKAPQIGNATNLLNITMKFKSWLSAELNYPKDLLHHMQAKNDLKISRYRLFRMIGDGQKHGIAGLSISVSQFEKALKNSNIESDHPYYDFQEFTDMAFDDFFNYHCQSTVPHFLISVRREIYLYLRAFVLSHKYSDGAGQWRWPYKFPKEVTSQIGKGVFHSITYKFTSAPDPFSFSPHPVFWKRK
ncbi:MULTISPECIES: hypothetical protein [unclassified Pseudovibrio]|uniref:hypothetical protein n=1 Tax=unclassified Pseudovibrio TaxID=2627060 RepID=UPI0007AEDB24|nr:MULTISPECIES: hypothetical protein [unclassified Pseudovibrio]KZL00448.1 hypothetical protein PsW74_02873 [Pseudovibrio sp. W74]KZL07448.1 hypothetical protein PsAD14_03833 [Pseudovibrio sp. Ad14]